MTDKLYTKPITIGELTYLYDTVKELEEYVKEENDPNTHDFLSALELSQEAKRIIEAITGFEE